MPSHSVSSRCRVPFPLVRQFAAVMTIALTLCGFATWRPAVAIAQSSPKSSRSGENSRADSDDTPTKPAPKPSSTETPAAPAKPAIAVPKSVDKLLEVVRKSVVVISVSGRDGKRTGLGSGFIVDAEGVIATNYHVIGEARPLTVTTSEGKPLEVTHIHAFDRHADLALVRVKEKNLPALTLGDSAAHKAGEPVVAVGNPLGLKHSVVTGVISGLREIEGRSMIQLAIPIEPGNSGGPLVTTEGEVLGIITMKSAVTDNLGFAVPINALKPLLEKPNSTPLSRWLTIGTLDPAEWLPLFGANWRQRAGRIQVEGLGQGFGGRSLCLWKPAVPKLPFEVEVSVKLDTEEGAAGLVFGSDGSEKHFGFYPSNGKLRLSRFDGPDVFSWKVLHEKPSSAYRPNDWNTLKVRVDQGEVRCFVNGELAVDWKDPQLNAGGVGLAKFRTTEASFKNFLVGKEIAASVVPADLKKSIEELLVAVPQQGPPADSLTGKIADTSGDSIGVLREQAKLLEAKANQIRKLAGLVHQKRVQSQLAKLVAEPVDKFDLVHAALWLARLDNDEVDVDAYRREFDRLALEIAASLPKDATEEQRLAGLHKHLFEELGFHGSRTDYYHRSNSYLNEVLDDREGLPITLSVLYMELARTLKLKTEGVGLPGHFVVRFVPEKGDGVLVDVFDGGKRLSRDDAEKLVKEATNRALRDEHLLPMSKTAILVRMLHNLMGLAQRSQDLEAMLKYADTILVLDPDLGEERFMRAVLRFQTRRFDEALLDVEWLQEKKPRGVNQEQVDELKRFVERSRT